MTNFSGTPLVGGSIFGLRAWGLRNGYLTSPAQHYTWYSGENVRNCKKIGDNNVYNEPVSAKEVISAIKNVFIPENCELTGSLTGDYTEGYYYALIDFELKTDLFGRPRDFFTETLMIKDFRWNDEGLSGTLKIKWEHLVPHIPALVRPHDMESCECGFYAFHGMDSRKKSPYDYTKVSSPSRGITGVLEGYGNVVMGPLGFRAEKGKIVALNIGSNIPPQSVTVLRSRYPDVILFPNEKAMLSEVVLGVRGLE